MTNEEKVYCICRTGETKDRFMIACDKCEDWFHGDCVQVTVQTAKNIKKFYCPPCQKVNPSLEIQFHHHHHHKKKPGSAGTNKDDQKPKTSSSAVRTGKRGRPPGSRNRVRCGRCIGCFRTEDCGKCDSCTRRKQGFSSPSGSLPFCQLRQCVNATIPAESKKQTSPKKKDRQRAKMKNVSRKKGEGLHSGGGRGLSGTRQNTRAYQEFMKEAGLISSEDEAEEHRQCLGIQCTKVARKRSKYCSDDCGMQMAKVRLCEILPGRLEEWRKNPSVAEQRQKEQLEAVRQRRETARQKLTELDGAEQRLEVWIKTARTFRADWDSNGTDESDGEEVNMFCSTCGMEIPAKTAMKHIVKCFSKYESQASYGSAFKTNNNLYNLFCDAYNKSNGTYCKRLRIICPEHSKDRKAEEWEICGYPLVEERNAEFPDLMKMTEFKPDMMCRVGKRRCTKHYQWEKLRKALIDTDRLAQLFKLDELFEEERGLRYALASRGGVLALLLHRTVHSEQS